MDSVPLATPDLGDSAAVARWRAAVNTGWGEDNDPAWPHESVLVRGVRCLVAGNTSAPTVVYVHGGGYVLGSAAVAIPITARLAVAARVISVDYRLAPEHQFPGALEDVIAVCEELSEAGTVYALAGDSAGGSLALGASLVLRDRGLAGPTAIALLSPHLDHAGESGPSLEAEETRPLLDAYLGETDPTDPLASPLRADLAGLAPVLIQVASGEPLAQQSIALSRRLRRAGTECVLDIWNGLWHTWHYHRDLPEADLALSEVRQFLRSRMP